MKCRKANSGALHLGLRYPEVFNMVISGAAYADYRGAIRRLAGIKGGRYVPKVERLWGKLEWDLKTSTGKGQPKSVWDELARRGKLKRVGSGLYELVRQ